MLYLLLFLGFLIALVYTLVIAKYLDGWNRTHVFPSKLTQPKTNITVVIAARNEELYIKECVESVLKNQYPKALWELIVVDNGSTDETFSILSNIESDQLKVLKLEEGFKKEALELAIQQAKGELILCTDADCVVSPFWLQHMSFQHEIHGASFILGPVAIKNYNDAKTRFQAFDMLAMMGVTAGGLEQDISYLANGANMAFEKRIYNQIGGIPRKDVASGDDVFLLHEFVRLDRSKVVFQKAKGAIVQTQALTSWKELVDQRIRWASKSGSYIHKKERYVSALVFLFCFFILCQILLIPFTAGMSFFVALFLLFIKATIDYMFLSKVNMFFEKKRLMKYFVSSFLLHFVYILFTGFSSIFGLKYNWKDRKPI